MTKRRTWYYVPTLYHSLFKSDHMYYFRKKCHFVRKKTLILRFDFHCAHVIILLFEFIKLEGKNLKCLTVSVNNKSNF